MFRIVDGAVFPKDLTLPNIDVNGGEFKGEQSIMALGQGGTTSLISRPQSRALDVKYINVVLNFFAHFIQRSPNDSIELGGKSRKVNIYFYTEDGTMSIVERPQLNSGIPQGTLCARAVVWKRDGNPVTEEDFAMGEALDIFGQTYHITDCDQSTRRYYQRSANGNPEVNQSFQGTFNASSMSQAQIAATALKSTFESDDFGYSTKVPKDEGTWGQHRSKKNTDKSFMEAKLGNTVNNSGRDGFMKYGKKTLKFRCVWDNTSMLYGDMVEFSLVYFLSDDTVEIFSASNSANCSKEQFSRLLQRSKLPKKFGVQSIGNNCNNTGVENVYYHWTDFYIGLDMDVYARNLKIIDADPATRVFYDNYDISLALRMEQELPVATVHEREVPPSTGFGSEEDSLRSCHGPLQPGPPRIKKLGENRVLTFLCILESGGEDTAHRRFVLTYYLQDQTLKVEEKPVRNSGFVGGVFLSRRVVQNKVGESVTEKHLYIGALVWAYEHEFRLLETDEVTLRWLEDKGLPLSNFSVILKKLTSDERLYSDAVNGNLAAKFELKSRSDNMVTKETLLDILRVYCPLGDKRDTLTQHEMISIIRAIGDRKNTVNYKVLIEQIISPSANEQ